MGVFSNAQGQPTPQSLVQSFRISNSSEILWLSSIPEKNEEDTIKNEDARVLTRLYVVFSNAQGQPTPQSLVQSFRISNSSEILWLSSIPEKNEEDTIKNEDARVLTRLYAVFSDAQGQLTPKSAVEFC